MTTFGYRGATAHSSWTSSSTPYDTAVINNINDGAAAAAGTEITSIPSPFARMALTNEAFAKVAANGDANLRGNSEYHRLVANALDIGEIFFNYGRLKNTGFVNILRWRVNDLIALQNATDPTTGAPLPAHRTLANTLQLYMRADAGTMNFNQLINGNSSLFLLTYQGPGARGGNMVIGATSPMTLFFAAGNDLSQLSPHLPVAGGNQLFQHDLNNNFYALHDREPEYILFWYKLQASIPNFAAEFPAVNAYLNVTINALPFPMQTQINNIRNDGADGYNLLPTLDVAQGVPVEVLSHPIKNRPAPNLGASDFLIRKSRGTNDPLVLPCAPFGGRKPDGSAWHYVNGPYQDAIHRAPVFDDQQDLTQRTLPGDGTQYPYLTMDDLLEKTLIEMSSPMCQTQFFDGNYREQGGAQRAFLLPIRRRYFDYFTPADLQNQLHMSYHDDAVGHHVTVELAIPTQGGTITYQRNYFLQAAPGAPVAPADGIIVLKDFSAVLFPMARFPNGVTPDYRAAFLPTDPNVMGTFTFYDAANQAIAPAAQKILNDAGNDAVYSPGDSRVPVYAVNANFDYVSVEFDQQTKGLFIPLWGGKGGGATFEFAVDFGTTNTHIEYKCGARNGGLPHPLDDTATQMGCLTDDALRSVALQLIIKNNFIPLHLDAQGDAQFPMHTLLNYHKGTYWNQPTSPFLTGGMAFYYDCGINPLAYKELKSNLKWDANDPDIQKEIEVFLGSLMHVMRNKVMMEGGTLADTKITWFYPTSLPPFMLGVLQNTWNNLYTQYFGGIAANVESMSESLAPYRHYAGLYAAVGNVLTIDIGGGTCDAVIVDQAGAPAYITSFRFAAEALLGDGFISHGGVHTNHFVSHFQPEIENVLQANGLNDVINRIHNVIAQTPRGADVTSFFFTLSKNPDIVRAKCENNVDFMQMMARTGGAKTLLLLFYTAIIYHLAHLIKAKQQGNPGIREPQHIAFSGNGSRLLQMLNVNTSAGKQNLENFTKAIFEKVNGRPYPGNLRILIDPQHPKESTCKGGLTPAPGAMVVAAHAGQHPQVCCLLGTADDSFTQDENYNVILTPAPGTQETQQEREKRAQVTQGLNDTMADFTDVFFALLREQQPDLLFGTMSAADMAAHRGLFTQPAEANIAAAANFYGLNPGNSVNSSLFFIPVTKLLHDLSQQLL